MKNTTCMDAAVLEYESRSAKTMALLKLQKARETRDASQTSLQRLKSERVVLGRVDAGNAAAMDARIAAAQTQVEANEQSVQTAQRECDKIACEPPKDAAKQRAAELEDQAKDKRDIAQQTGNVLASNDDTLPVWAYVLIAVAVLGFVAGLAWFLTREPSQQRAPEPTPAPGPGPVPPPGPAPTPAQKSSMPIIASAVEAAPAESTPEAEPALKAAPDTKPAAVVVTAPAPVMATAPAPVMATAPAPVMAIEATDAKPATVVATAPAPVMATEAPVMAIEAPVMATEAPVMPKAVPIEKFEAPAKEPALAK